MRPLSTLTGCCTAAALLLLGSTPAGADPNNINPIPVLNGMHGLPNLPGPTLAVAQLTGMDSPNHTERQNVLGTDLGIMWDNKQGQMLTAYGDTAGMGLPNILAGSIWAWRSNVLFTSPAGADPSGGVNYNGFIDNPLPSPKIPGIEISFIPTAGIAANGAQYMSMMSVQDWGPDGHWDTNFCTLAVSNDGGRTWAQLPATRRANENGFENFQQAAFLEAGGYVYRYGTPGGRNNPGFIARVHEGDIANIDAYEYWDGGKWVPGKADAAAPIVGGVGELSVMWNDHLQRYIMLTTDPFDSVVMRTASSPEGPWDAPRVLVDVRDLKTAYAPMIYPYQTGNSLYFALTLHNEYNTVLMRTPL